MFDRSYGIPLTSSSASPSGSVSGEPANQHTNWDSVIDGYRTSLEDSLFEKTGYKTIRADDDSVFRDGNNSDPGYLPANHFRPVSMMSVSSGNTAPKDNDTMITIGFKYPLFDVQCLISSLRCSVEDTFAEVQLTLRSEVLLWLGLAWRRGSRLFRRSLVCSHSIKETICRHHHLLFRSHHHPALSISHH